ncbi:MAG: electron transport complex subunit RsxC [Acutalibacteraceae bacterium]|nr:electron transport complex subunit RsxC [Acutalibacteraceae bacterium]
MEKSRLALPEKPFRIHGGANTPHRKNTRHSQSVVMPCPEQVVLPMSQHIGAPCKPCVKKGFTVAVGDVIGESTGHICAPIHASISGKVSKITQVRLPNGHLYDAVVIESDGEMRMSKSIKPPVINSDTDLIKAVHDSGLVGLGGAGFPSHVKIDIHQENHCDTLIVNCSECEPYITADNREAVENTEDVLYGIITLLRYLHVERAIIGVEDNKPDAIKSLKAAINNCKEKEAKNICVLKLRSRYPQGAEKVLIKACTGRTVPPHKLPVDVGCIVMNITSVGFLGSYIKTGVPLISKRVTVDGSAVNEAKNVIVPIGTSVRDIIDFCGGYKETCGKLIIGGPMTGVSVPDDSCPILKQNNAVLALNKKDSLLPPATDCIRCGRCIKSCPMKLAPVNIETAVKMKDIDALNKNGVTLCMECGSCAYNCPAHRGLVQIIRMGKAMVHNAAKE